MPFPRLAGMILHPTSLPGGSGVGDLGASARAFVDFLAQAGVGIWQVLPLGPVGGANSPYQSPSSHAGNTLLVSLDLLAEEFLLKPSDLANMPPNTGRVDFPAAAAFKDKALRIAMANFKAERCSVKFMKGFEAFVEEEKDWLDDYALFAAVKSFFDSKPWYEWKDLELRRHQPKALDKYNKLLASEIRFHKFCQYAFFSQWRELRTYAAERNVKFMGDVPIYCAHDSADVWAAPGFFQLDEDGAAAFMAGVPPDYFSQTGQLWGNPLYNWNALADDGYQWWTRRIKAALALVDMLRIDHFRGFEAYWSVARGEETAINGRWIRGPGQAFFDTLRGELGDDLPIVAEDLGVITPRVDRLRLDNGLPGMKVIHFAFGEGAEAYLPHTYETNCVCYVGTHDNDTTRGWYDAAGPDYEHMDRSVVDAERDKARRYLGRDGSGMPWDMMRLALSSVADTAIVMMQDLLGLDNGCRMNRPGKSAGQWEWRLAPGQLESASAGGLRDMVALYDRLPVKQEREAVEDVDATEE